MPIFLDGHNMKDLSQEDLEKAVNLPKDGFGITHLEIFHNKNEDRLYCVLEAPNEEAIWKHHESFGLKCEFVTKIQQIKTEKNIKAEKLAILGELASDLSHDLRNPVSVIQNTVDLMNIKYQGKLNSDILEAFSRINRSVARMNMLITGVLDFARTRPLILEKYSLLDIICSSLDGIPVPSNIKIIMPQNDISLECDKVKLEVVFYNLITNAIQSIGEKTPGEISIKLTKKEDEIQIDVQNSGHTIPEEFLSKIFEPLFTTKEHGTGLGLPSCKNIIGQHQGTISVRNNPVTFTILLPKNIKISPTVS